MSLWTIYIKISEGGTGFTRMIKAPDLTNAKKDCLEGIRRCLKGRKSLYLESRGGGRYLIVSDMDEIGEAEIQKITKMKAQTVHERFLCLPNRDYGARLLSAKASDLE